MKGITTGALFAVLIAGLALAQTGGDVLSFEELDRDIDSHVSWQEFRQAFPDVEREMFDEFDADNTGKLNQEQWSNARTYLMNRGYQVRQEPPEQR
jgi:hypothetical protein